MCSHSLTEEKSKHLGSKSGSRGLKVDEFLARNHLRPSMFAYYVLPIHIHKETTLMESEQVPNIARKYQR